MELTKGRLVALVVVTTAVGFVMASPSEIAWGRLVLTLLGTALTAAGSMALNEVMEMERDALMERTRHRPLPAGEIAPLHATVLGVAAAVAGVAILALAVNLLTAALDLAVVLLYVGVYTPLKPRTTLCTLAGAVCGAIPPMMGWTAASGSLGFGAWFLALVLFLWQIPHFLALAWMYRDDYARGGFKVLPVVDEDGRATTLMVNVYTLALLAITVAAALTGLVGLLFAVGALLLGGAMLALGVQLSRARSRRHARRLFFATLAYLPLLLTLMVADRSVPQPLHVTARTAAAAAGPATASDVVPAGLR